MKHLAFEALASFFKTLYKLSPGISGASLWSKREYCIASGNTVYCNTIVYL